jgi:general secretion pathway protein K
LQYQPRNKGFQTIEELQMVLGMDAETFQWMEPLITVYSGQAQVDKNATREVLSIIPGVDSAVIQQFLLARLDSAKSGRPLLFPLSSPYINATEVQGGAVSIIAEAKLPDGSRAAVAALVMKSEIDPVTPFQVLKWQRSYANEISLFSMAMNELLVAQYNEPQFND